MTRCECGRLNDDGGREQLTWKQEISQASVEENTESTEFCNKLWKVYITACEDYTPRGVTYPTDTLPAVSSLMYQFMPHLGKYYAGLWEHNILVSLQWEAKTTTLCTRHEDYVAPSVSWLNISPYSRKLLRTMGVKD
jgi:hypothetical protein